MRQLVAGNTDTKVEPDLNDVLTPKESTTPLKVLLIQPPIEDFYTTPIRFYPLGLLYVAGILEKMGYRVQILDCLTPLIKQRVALPKCFHYLEPFLQEHSFPFKTYFRFGISEETMLSRIRGFAPDMIGISAQFTAYFETVQTLAALIKRNFTVPVFIGGNHATVLSEAIKQRTNNIDFVVKGPAEQCLPAFLRPQNPQLATDMPCIDWAEVPPAHYLLKGNDYTIGRNNYISLIASRGCPFDCDFCNVRIMFGREIRYRTIDRVIKEMRWNYVNKMVRIFNFEDDNLSYLRSWFLEFLQAVIDDPVLKDIELTAMNGLCYPTLDEELLEKMGVAGFKRLNLSYVTKDTSLQQQYHRPRHSSNFESIIRTAQNLGLLVTLIFNTCKNKIDLKEIYFNCSLW
ncbi:MAG: cobalamin-dependent protein, partial [Patescibacteria group bacterium]